MKIDLAIFGICFVMVGCGGRDEAAVAVGGGETEVRSVSVVAPDIETVRRQFGGIGCFFGEMQQNEGKRYRTVMSMYGPCSVLLVAEKATFEDCSMISEMNWSDDRKNHDEVVWRMGQVIDAVCVESERAAVKAWLAKWNLPKVTQQAETPSWEARKSGLRFSFDAFLENERVIRKFSFSPLSS